MKITTYIHVLSVVIGSVIGSRAEAQTTQYLTLEQAIDIMLNGNWQLQIAQQRSGIAKADVVKANSVFLPSVNVSETFTTTTDPMMAFGTKLGQSNITAQDFNPELLNNPNAIENFATRIEVLQPILNVDGIYGRQAAKSVSDAVQHQERWTKTIMVLHTKMAYYQLVIAKKSKETVGKAVISAKANFQTAQNLYDQGVITYADLMGAELRYTQVKSQSLQAVHAVSLVNQQLLQLLGSESNMIIEPRDSLALIDLNMESIQDMQMGDQRADLLAMEHATKAGELNKRSQQLGFVPRVNAFGSYGFNDTEIFGTKANNYLVGVQLKWDLFQGGKQIGNVQRAKHESELAALALEEKQASAKREIIQLKNDLVLAKEQVQLSELAVKQAKEMYAIRTDRFAEGLEKTSDLLLAESNYLNKQLGVLQAKNHYLQILFKLETELAHILQ